MAGIQGSNQLVDLLRALKRRRYQVAVPALLIASVGISLAVMWPKRYKVATRIEISDRTRVEFDARLKNPNEVAIRREAASASDHIRNYKRVKSVIEANLAQWPEYVKGTDEQRQQLINETIIKKSLSAQPTVKDPKNGGSIFIDISFSDEDRERAAKFLKDLTESWLTEMQDTDKDTLLTERATLQQMIDNLAKDLREKEERYYEQVQLLGQDPTTPGGDDRRENRGDWTFRELEKQKSNLADVEFQLDTAEFELQQARERLAAEPDKVTTPIVVEGDDPDSEIGKLEELKEKLEERLANLRPTASQYRIYKPKLEQVTSKLEELRGVEPTSSIRYEQKDNPLVAEYRSAVRALEDRAGKLKNQREDLVAYVKVLDEEAKARTNLYKNLDELRNQVSEARKFLNETTQQWQERDKSLAMLDSAPNPWQITQPPVPTSAATQPNAYLLSAVAVVLGLALGLGGALVSEFARSCYRSVGDLASVMSVPVLGAIETILTRRERRRIQLSRAVAGLSTAMIVGTIGWITWLWYSSPERLPLEVQEAIERMRSALK